MITKTPKKPLPCFKYFINKTVCLQQYREALKLCYKFSDNDTREHMLDMMKHEEVQANIDYIMAKTRQRINQVKEMSERVQ